MKQRAQKVLSAICIILAVLSIIATGFFIIMMNSEKKVNDAAISLIDSRSLYLMQGTSRVNILKKIYGVYDETSYKEMKNSTLISDDVRRQFFNSDSYLGNYTSKPDVTISEVRYSPSTSALVSRYYTNLVVTYNDDVRSYNLIVEFVDNRLISISVIP